MSNPSFVAIAADFTDHPKVIALGSTEDRWTWLQILCYAVRFRTEGKVPPEIVHVIPGATSEFLERCVQVGLLERFRNSLRIHDFDEFNGSKRERTLAKERKRRQREREKEERERGMVTGIMETGHDDVTLESRLARARTSSMSNTKVKTKILVRGEAENANGEPASAEAVEAMIAALGVVDPVTADMLRGLGYRASVATIQELHVSARAGLAPGELLELLEARVT